MHPCRLDAVWHEATGSLAFVLTNLSGHVLEDFRLAYTALTRARPDHRCEGGRLVRKVANFHEFVPDPAVVLEPGGRWRFTLGGLNRVAKHRTDGPKSAYLTLGDGSTWPVECGDLMHAGGASAVSAPLLPEGAVQAPLSVLPWPQRCQGTAVGTAPPVALFPAEGSSGSLMSAMATVSALAARLFPEAPAPFAMVEVEGALAVAAVVRADLAAEAYAIRFTEGGVAIEHGSASGLTYALITLAQCLHGARTRPDLFGFPIAGAIEDAPRHGWRGCHLDVSRQFYPLSAVTRMVDILAWHKLNVLHWHLTDDEGWRIEIEAYPELIAIGSKRGAREAMPAQLGSAAETYGGHYGQDEVRRLVAHAARLHIQVVPEIDIPGHCTAVLHALPQLVDPGEPESYWSIQGYPNNALNPALPQTYAFLDTVLGELAGLFPAEVIHIGGDEVAPGSWLQSPAAKALMAAEGLAGTPELQAYFMRRVKAMLTARGKVLGGWEEVAHGGGVDPEGTLLTAWTTAAAGTELAVAGYDVVIAPGQAYYLDMVQTEDWQEPGASWAGTVPPERTYSFDAEAGFPAEHRHRLKGVQACIWSENLINAGLFNRLVFPRLSAIAEAAWTPAASKDWQRFCALSRLMPRL